MLILAVLLALVASVRPISGHAQSGWPSINGTITVINDGPGDQRDAHVSGNLVAYYSSEARSSYIHYYDFLTGTDLSIPKEEDASDFLLAIDGTRIVYTHVTGNPYAINFFDIITGGSPVTLDPIPNSLRERPAIGGQAVVWMDLGDGEPSHSEIVVYDLTSGTTTQLTNDSNLDLDPDISPDGSLIVWTKCQVYLTDCHTWQAANNGSGWDVTPVAGTGNQLQPATDGQYIVYYGSYGANGSDKNIFWQQRGMNTEHELSLPGTQRNPAIDNGLVVFESFNSAVAVPNWDLMLYDINHDRGFRVTNTDASELLSDIAVVSDGMVHVVWQQTNTATGSDIFASTFRLPSTENQPPVIEKIIAPLDPTMVNSTVPVTATFSDPNLTDTHTATWDWGDGNPESGVVSEANGTGTVSGSHAYATPGVYVVTLTVTDNHDASNTGIFQYVVVYDPSAGFVTGSGWIESPAGAYIPDPALTGKAHFGFVSRYQKGASLPSGKTEFQFKAGGLSFRSTAYDWLVIAGAKAQFKGTGTINGSGDYGFLLTVTDNQTSGGGNVDKFRIKIWDRETGTVIYDNQLGADQTADPSTAIGGGAIVIHK
jgi:Tol biopolymer transport system component